ncbi:hypothetical protein EHW99_0891 [Erwinia amylovora]|uniref:Uncharacterized protein n=3 Tax=Erwinia amylovora TaxID=552 RepID=A0A831A0D2_ERWAM|nr:hypothetical protein EaACW_2728 [Erwinia amylovora ACW56400]QJQ53598.1 hypothetical protein EHX00_0891 [Erwinia amylovora]CBA22256.1 hypothetical protein predicted by Glimmer/Critica [Erwinia amylovora CFBP1430]CBX81585.1 hypothetical protein predicted by Glimmer/Critica [Erwinia amylovora ATCC BAA-2158]CCO79573.1 hypothetical protein BN432_2794 [Erwinia amylovora Ea356]CCO83375.1 hypothetical protein BN433_2816 [Erwinia amylovora Ea266]CCO87137.1 hypothetical protein BN434_2767 [Erwinia a
MNFIANVLFRHLNVGVNDCLVLNEQILPILLQIAGF